MLRAALSSKDAHKQPKSEACFGQSKGFVGPPSELVACCKHKAAKRWPYVLLELVWNSGLNYGLTGLFGNCARELPGGSFKKVV